MDNALTFPDADAISAESAGDAFGAVIDHAADDKARVVLTRDGKAVAAIVPIEDYDALEAIEDAHDAKLAGEAMAVWEAAGRPRGVSHEELLARYGIAPE